MVAAAADPRPSVEVDGEILGDRAAPRGIAVAASSACIVEPDLSMVARAAAPRPGGTATVVSLLSMSAGPTMLAPGPSVDQS